MMQDKAKNRRIRNNGALIDSFLVAALVLGVMTILYIIYGYAPFGNNSLACMDANIQYLDFFAYFQDVLKGKNSLTQTFSSFLGGNNIGTFTYYLASPFNLFVVFFDKANLHAFFDILVVLKIVMAAVAFCVFLHVKFHEYLKSGLQARMFCILLSLGYALNQYTIAQSSNIMWLDGVYMLPLILIGVHYIVWEKSGWRLSLFVGISIILNWYTGGMNCLFSGFWICFEIALYLCHEKQYSAHARMRKCCGHFVQYLLSMVAGILLSMVLFWPTVLAMRNSSKGDLAFKALGDFSFIGAMPSVIQGYTLGAKSSYGSVALFCGSTALIGCILCFLSKGISLKEKSVFGVMLGGVVLLFYWKPLHTMFSLFKPMDSYWYRYSYVGILSILFLAAYFWIKEVSEVYTKSIWQAGIIWAGMLVFLDYLKPSQDRKLTYFTAVFVVLTAVMLVSMLSVRKHTDWQRKVVYIVYSLLTVFELAYGAKLQMYNYHTSDVEAYQKYVGEQERRIKEIVLKEEDGMYRISQTTTRNHDTDMNRTANYNEALSFGYASINGYTSVPDDVQMDFLHRLGYRKEGACITIVNTCLLGADSLLSVKYVLSEYPVNGLIELDVNKDNKKVYENPFCLPFAFMYKENLDGRGSQVLDDNQNPFEYQNMLYSKLIGESVELYNPLTYSKSEGEKKDTLVYSLQIPAGNWAVYGNIPWEWNADAVINVNYVYKQAYSRWLSPSVFYIPTENKGNEEWAVVEISAVNCDGLKEGAEQFYALDLDVLKEVSKLLKGREVDALAVENGKASFAIEADKTASLFVSIPYDSGWVVKNNGKKITASMFADCMYSIPLHEGENHIEMIYHLPGADVGMVGSGLGCLLVLGMVFIEKRGVLTC